MAHLWTREAGGEWAARPLETDREELAAGPRERSIAILRAPDTDAETWLLVCGRLADVRVNGDPVLGGLRVLSDRDEIVARGVRRYFSTETLARISAIPAGAALPRCPRCRQPIEAGTEAVRCPHCGIWHHQSAALPCWTYADTCANCPQPTDLEAGYRWVPA